MNQGIVLGNVLLSQNIQENESSIILKVNPILLHWVLCPLCLYRDFSNFDTSCFLGLSSPYTDVFFFKVPKLIRT